MPRTISAEFLAQIQAEATSFAGCILITPLIGDPVGFTNHEEDITFEGQTYSASPGMSVTEFASSYGYAVDNLEISGVFDEQVTKDDCQGGVYDDAECLIFLIDYENHSYGKMILQRGTVGNLPQEEGTERWTFELRGLSQQLQQNAGETTGPNCRADLGDERCKIDLEEGTHPLYGIPYHFTATANADGTRLQFVATISGVTIPAGYFETGKLIWTGGVNLNQKSEVKTHTVAGDVHTIMLQDPLRSTISEGDEFKVYHGCKKRLQDCVDKENVDNMRAEPHLIGIISMLKTPRV
ncbi:MAG: hypothetical protein QOD00_1694 [Blastocatellia bacterium]|nr:hypothetical protein [Blastocatellia bacterium]